MIKNYIKDKWYFCFHYYHSYAPFGPFISRENAIMAAKAEMECCECKIGEYEEIILLYNNTSEIVKICL